VLPQRAHTPPRETAVTALLVSFRLQAVTVRLEGMALVAHVKGGLHPL
jgi:hypothetical protein